MRNKEVSNKRKIIVFSILAFGIMVLALVANIPRTSAVETPTQEAFVCAERTVSGAWCQNVPESEADPSSGYRVAPTSCSSTSFCKPGTCVDSFEGLCQGNTPQRVCEESGGVWNAKKPTEIPQCGLGCCFIGDGASFVTQTRCSALSSAYGVNTEFDKSIKSEAQCIASAFPKEKGACVVDGFQRECKLTTREECQNLGKVSGEIEVEFNGGFLCSAEALGTVCGPTGGATADKVRTVLIDGRDEVYFADTCGNPANVYDASKIKDQEYWTKIIKPEDSCELKYNGDGNPTNSAKCGNCNYFEGSIGKTYVRNNLMTPVEPSYGNFVCAQLSCKWQEETYQHGESWCASTAKSGLKNNPGAEDARLVCQFGKVTVESCSIGSPVGRNKVCVEDSIDVTGDDNGFSFAGCRINKWQDCVLQDNEKDCENLDKRDCSWKEGVSVLGEGGFIGQGAVPFVVNGKGELVQKDEGRPLTIGIDAFSIKSGATCVPKNAPGFEFWGQEETEGVSDIEERCLIASRDCVVKFQRNAVAGALGGDWDCKENCDCIAPNWGTQMNNMCVALGDCGAANNYVNKLGYNSFDDLYKVTKGVSSEGD